MPDLVTHVWFARRTALALTAPAAEKLTEDVYLHASAGPDIWFFCGWYGGGDKALSPRGGYMHENDTGVFLSALAERCRESAHRDLLFSYLAGYLCHYCLDRTAHPYIIYRTGDYDGTPETLRYRGNHTRLERAIDAHFIREGFRSSPRRFDLVGKALPLRRLPEELREELDSVYYSVYGWKNVWAALNRAIADQRKLYRLLRDPLGVLNPIAKLADNGRSTYDYRYFSYQGRELDKSGIDYLNLERRPWKNFADPSLISTESFPELMERACRDAVQLINVIYNYVYLKTETITAVRHLIGNASYTSGLDCRDGRNFGEKTFDPLF